MLICELLDGYFYCLNYQHYENKDFNPDGIFCLANPNKGL